ncbi:MAG: SBBP repeat-containing protein [Candidatus Bathyarchaeia archaeon]
MVAQWMLKLNDARIRRLACFLLIALVATMVPAQAFAVQVNFQKTWGGSSFDNGSGVAVDGSGNVYVTGVTASFGAGGQDVFLLKYDSSGSLQFQKTWGGTSGDGGYGVAVDGSGNVYVTGSTSSFGAGGGDAFLLKYDSSGSLQFQKTWGGIHYDEGDGVAVSGGVAYVTGIVSEGSPYVFSSVTGTVTTPVGSVSSPSGITTTPSGTESSPSGTVTTPSGSQTYAGSTDVFLLAVNTVSDTITSEVSLVQGWNLISLPIVSANTAIGTVLASQIAAGDFSIVWSYQGGAWKSATLNPTTHTLSGTLTTMQDGAGYWILMTRADNLFVVGNVFGPPPALPPSYPLSAGWNLVGFKPEPDPRATTETVSVYLTSISGDYDASNVWVYTGSWVRATSTTMLTPGEAMWILMTTPATLRP